MNNDEISASRFRMILFQSSQDFLYSWCQWFVAPLRFKDINYESFSSAFAVCALCLILWKLCENQVNQPAFFVKQSTILGCWIFHVGNFGGEKVSFEKVDCFGARSVYVFCFIIVKNYLLRGTIHKLLSSRKCRQENQFLKKKLLTAAPPKNSKTRKIPSPC